jgi:hypothetical protein
MNGEQTGVIFQRGIPTNSGVGGLNIDQITAQMPANILYSVLGLLAILMGGVTIVLYYHWLRYGFGDRMVIFAQVLYTIVLVLSFIVMLTSASHYA